MADTYAPKWAPHASGSFERAQDPVTGGFVPTWVELSCSECGATHRAWCESGAPTQHVLSWAKVHLHRDPMK